MKLGFIGCGDMGKAMLGGILKNQILEPGDVCVSALHQNTLDEIHKTYQVDVTLDNREVAKAADILILAVKPQYYGEVIEEIRDVMKKDAVFVSIAPGKRMEWFYEQFGRKPKIVRCMPNTPALVGEGMTGVCCNELVSQSEKEEVLRILQGFGHAEEVTEPLMDVVVSVSGSAPAYVFLFIEAMADAAVADGMPRAQAYRFASQAVLGSARMVLETGRHPGELKDMVCSPGGTTIEAVRVLEAKGMRSAVIEAMKACCQKGKEV